MKNFTKEILRGLKVIQKLLNPKEIVIGIEEENKELIEIFEKVQDEEEFKIKIELLPVIYPQGSELQLINTITGKEVKKGELPLEKGVIVSNVSTVKAIYDAFFEGKPLTERIVTISGEKAKNIGNYRLKFGTPVYHIVRELKITNEDKVIFGGPMMGTEIFDSRVPTVKGTSGILFLDTEEIERKSCISCGYCVEACPMNLMPFEFADYYKNGKYEKMATANIQNCIECGACEFVCPSRVPLMESIKTGKLILSELEVKTMKNNEKSLMEEILGRKKDNSKNELLDNDDTLLNSTVHSLPKTEKLQNNYSQNSETNKNNNKVKNLNNTGKLEKVKKIKEKEIKKDKIDIKKIFSKKEVPESDKEIKRKKIIKSFFKKRKLKKLSFTPYIRTEIEVRNIMKDVIISLFPAIIASALVYGTRALLLIAFSVLSAVVTEKLFSKYFLNDNNSVHDLSAVITGILLAMTLAPLTPLPIVIFGACMAVIFGKLIYGGIGKTFLILQ